MSINWNTDEFRAILEDLNKEIATDITQLRQAQKSIASADVSSSSVSSISDDEIDFVNNTIPERGEKPFVEISLNFNLSSQQISDESTKGNVKTLAKNLLPGIALAEDFYIFQTSDRSHDQRDIKNRDYRGPANVQIKNWQLNDGFRDYGLLSAANPDETSDTDWSKVSKPIQVPLIENHGNGTLWGNGTARAVLKGIGNLMKKKSKGDSGFALYLPIEVWSDAMIPEPDEESSAIELIHSMHSTNSNFNIEIFPSTVLPKNEGLLINLAGEPIKILYKQHPQVMPDDVEDGQYHFRISERLQYTIRDPRALLLLKFDQPNSGTEYS